MRSAGVCRRFPRQRGRGKQNLSVSTAPTALPEVQKSFKPYFGRECKLNLSLSRKCPDLPCSNRRYEYAGICSARVPDYCAARPTHWFPSHQPDRRASIEQNRIGHLLLRVPYFSGSFGEVCAGSHGNGSAHRAPQIRFLIGIFFTGTTSATGRQCLSRTLRPVLP